MSKIADTTIVLRDKQLQLTRRARSSLWQVHYKIHGTNKWLRKTTGKIDLEEAKEVAEDLYHEAKLLQKRGLAVTSKKFKSVAEVVSKDLKEKVKSKQGPKSYADYYRAIDTYLIPFFGNYHVDSIKTSAIDEFHIWRTEKVGFELKASTQANHNAALNYVFDFSISKGYMSPLQKPQTKNTGEASESRGIFTTEEIIKLERFLRSWSEETGKEKSRQLRELLGLYIAFVAGTGLRPGTETAKLKWKHLAYTNRPSGRYLSIFVPAAKRQERTIVPRQEIRLVLEKLKQLQGDIAHLTLDEIVENKIDKPLFLTRDGNVPKNFPHLFADCLEASGMSVNDTDGKKRSLYSLRHYYATERILEGMSWDLLAKQMGTSNAMIEMHYSHLKPLMKVEELAGVTSSGKEQVQDDIEKQLYITPAKAHFMHLMSVASGISIPLIEQNPEATEALVNELDSLLAKRS